ncbi:MAG TPA: toll/interleukin-1 receptor domain-containing protein, partial [Steroidobacteraceae bacterium]|nr:toll/interleukin-1 receptor domain-containing protein [Steroidobacteraceae bacterium]
MTETSRAVFLSYASEDAEPAQRICEALRAAAIEVWFDKSELRGGDAWDQTIRQRIRECRLFMPLISAATDGRGEGYFRREWKLAVDRTEDMAADMPFLVPVVIDDTSGASARVPPKFRDLQWTRLAGGNTPPEFVARVAALLRGAPLPAAPAERA